MWGFFIIIISSSVTQWARHTRLLWVRIRVNQDISRQSPWPGAQQWSFPTTVEDELVPALPLSTHSAVEMLHESALYKFMIDIDIDQAHISTYGSLQFGFVFSRLSVCLMLHSVTFNVQFPTDMVQYSGCCRYGSVGQHGWTKPRYKPTDENSRRHRQVGEAWSSDSEQQSPPSMCSLTYSLYSKYGTIMENRNPRRLSWPFSPSIRRPVPDVCSADKDKLWRS